jgi:hypothetical protein
MAFGGISFRATSTFVTDAGGDTYSLGEAYPTTRGGFTFGFDTNLTANSRDRGTTTPRLAGIVFMANSGAAKTFTWDLPSGAGTYNSRLALGDGGASQTVYCVIKDGGTTLATLGPTTTGAANQFIDSAGNNRTDSNWVASNTTIQKTFSGSTMVLELGGASGGSGNTAIAHVAVEFVSGGGGASSLRRKLLLRVG